MPPNGKKFTFYIMNIFLNISENDGLGIVRTLTQAELKLPLIKYIYVFV